MKMHSVLLMVAMALTFVTKESHADFINGGELAAWARSYDKLESKQTTSKAEFRDSMAFVGYIDGTIDTFAVFAVVNKGNPKYRLPPGTSRTQLAAVISKYLRNHPEKWNNPAPIMVIDALIKSFPANATTNGMGINE